MCNYIIDKKEKKSGSLLRSALCLLLSIFIVLTVYVPASAAVYTIGFSYIYKDIYIDGYHINNYQLEHPFMGSSGSTYIPLDTQVKELLGIDLRIGDGRIQIVLTQPKHYSAPSDLRFVKNHFEGTVGKNYPDDVEILLCDRFRTAEDFEALEKIEDLRAYYSDCLENGSTAGAERLVISRLLSDLPDKDGGVVPLAMKPSDFYLCGSVVYVRASALAACPGLPFSIYYDNTGGFAVSTDPKVDAKDQFSFNNKSYIDGRIAYLKSVQKLLSDNDAQILEYLFRHEATVNGVSEDLNMAIARTESTYNLSLNRINGGRPIGLMQLMPGTVTGSGWTLDEVCTPHGNIQFGTSYIAAKLRQYNGNEVIALSAYNQGSGTVASGHYSTAYAHKVLGFKSGIASWCASHGYSNTFYEVSEKVR